ncbi:hypothetical protein [Streptomyces sp. TRM70350]|uniref:hypothetical protein n=1 Tax=Streptomyces sp. TRM70350 TaxID=2856165 RepID=UPI0021103436|nr:hypothetical protein [Streptomyces sp. TRM70350]
MASVLGMLEEREAAARVRVEGLREEAARLAEVLEAAEIELDRRVIAREELVEALAVSAAESTAVTTTEAEEEAVPSLAPVPGSTVPPWREGLPVTVLAPDYQRIVGVLEQQRSMGPGAASSQGDRGGAGPWGDAGEGRGAAVESPAPGGARVAPPGGVGGIQCRPAARGRARRRLIRVTIDHRIIASLVAGRAS